MIKKSWLRFLLLLVLAAVAVGCAFYFDAEIQYWIAHHQSRPTKIFMRNVSRWGDWPAHAVLGVILILIAYWRGNKKWDAYFCDHADRMRLSGSGGSGH